MRYELIKYGYSDYDEVEILKFKNKDEIINWFLMTRDDVELVVKK